VSVIKEILGNIKANNNLDLVEVMLTNFPALGAKRASNFVMC